MPVRESRVKPAHRRASPVEQRDNVTEPRLMRSPATMTGASRGQPLHQWLAPPRKETPSRVSVRQTTWHERRSPPGISNSNVAGIPNVVEVCRQAPVSEMFRIAQSIFGALSPKAIFPDFKIRARRLFLRSFIDCYVPDEI